MSRVFFADIYKEYECLHKYVAKLAEKYRQVWYMLYCDISESHTQERYVHHGNG